MSYNDDTSDKIHLSKTEKLLIGSIITMGVSLLLGWTSTIGHSVAKGESELEGSEVAANTYKFCSILCGGYNYIVQHAVEPFSENIAKIMQVDNHAPERALFATSFIAMGATICLGCIQNKRNKKNDLKNE